MRLRAFHVLILPVIIACGDSLTPPEPVEEFGPPGVRIVQGRSGSDTIESTLPIVAEMRGSDGRLMPNMQLEFLGDSRVQLRQTPTGAGVSRIVATTDAQGRARAWVFLNWYAGPAHVYAGAKGIGYDTASYTVRPGLPVGVRVSGARVVYLPEQGTFTPQFTAVDRRENAIAGLAVTLSGSGRVSLGAGNVVTALSAGLGWVYGVKGTARDSVLVSVLPALTIAFEKGPGPAATYGAYTQQLGVSGAQFVGYATGGYYSGGLDWSPDGTRLLHGGRLTTIGGSQVTLPVPPGYAHFPEVDTKFSPDGEWIYFTAPLVNTQARSLLRMKVATGEFEELLGGGTTSYREPAVSPDGATLVVVSYATASPATTRALVRVDVATRAVTPLNVDGRWPRYTPDGSRVAFLKPTPGGSLLATMAAAGGAVSVVSPTVIRTAGFGISPDGAFVAISMENAPLYCSQLHLIRLSNGEISPLPITGYLNDCVSSTAFRP